MSLTYYIATSFLEVVLTGTLVYLLSRLKEDAKNQSLLDHISDLTKKTESVKKEFNEELERVRHELEVLTNMQNVLFEESKNSIIEFLSNISNWYYNLTPGIFEYNQTNYESIDERIALMSRDYQLTNNSFSKIQLIVDNDALIEAANDTFLGFMEVDFYVENSLKTLKRNLISEKHNLDMIFKEGKDFWKQENGMKDYVLQRSKSNEKEKSDLNNEFPKKRQEMILAAIQKKSHFINLGKQFIKKGLK